MLEVLKQKFRWNGVKTCKTCLVELGGFMWQGLVNFYNLFLVPVGNWVFGECFPRFIDALTNGLATVNCNKITDSLRNLWNSLAPYSGKFVVRIPKTLHKVLTLKAQKEGVSLNQYALYKLAN